MLSTPRRSYSGDIIKNYVMDWAYSTYGERIGA